MSMHRIGGLGTSGFQLPRIGRLVWFGIALVVFLIVAGAVQACGVAGYAFHPVGPNEVGVKFNQSHPYEVVGPGVYSKLGFFESIQNISIRGLPFKVLDPEVLTHDKQRIGLEVSGTVHRPDLTRSKTLLENWGAFSNFYTNDLALNRPQTIEKDGNITDNGGLMSPLSQQAMKVCVGDADFDKAIIGSARDDLKNCIEVELSKIASGYGLEVRNVVVPTVKLNTEVQKKLDAITQARLATQLAVQEQDQATAEAKRNNATEQGKIFVEQGKVQEKSKQDAITADLNKKALDAQRQVIEADKSNQLLAANKTKEIADVDRQTALINAQARIAEELAKAQAYAQNPLYVELLKIQAEAAAYTKLDKWIMVPSGVNPLLFFGQTPPSIAVPPTPK